MISTSETVEQSFIEVRPDFAKPVIVTSEFTTSIAESADETRQRAKWSARPRYGISYTVSALAPAAFTARRSAALAELAGPVVVPVWTDEFALVSYAGLTAVLDATLTRKKFKPGSYAYFVQAANTLFAKIASISGNQITFVAGTVLSSFTAGTTIYPCITGVKPANSAAFILNRVEETDEMINVEEL